MEGTESQGPKPGVFFISNFRVKTGWGHVPVSIYPIDNKTWPPIEPLGLDNIAKYNRTPYYQRINSLKEIQASLYYNELIQISVPVTKQWYTAAGGIIQMPSSSAEIIEMHAVQPVGYDNDCRQLKFRNSWGENWGSNGYGYLPYEYLDQYISEAWHYGGHTSERPTRKLRKSHKDLIISWGIRQPWLGTKLHCIEVHDTKNDEKAGWAIIVEKDGELVVDDLYVRRQYRRRGFGLCLGNEVFGLAKQLGLSVCFLISTADTDTPAANLSALNSFLRKLGLNAAWFGKHGIKYVAKPGALSMIIKSSAQPDSPPIAFLPNSAESRFGIMDQTTDITKNVLLW